MNMQQLWEFLLIFIVLEELAGQGRGGSPNSCIEIYIYSLYILYIFCIWRLSINFYCCGGTGRAAQRRESEFVLY